MFSLNKSAQDKYFLSNPRLIIALQITRARCENVADWKIYEVATGWQISPAEDPFVSSEARLIQLGIIMCISNEADR